MAVIEALKAVPTDASAEDVYKRVKVMMESMGLVDQQPMLDGSAARPQAAAIHRRQRELKSFVWRSPA